MKLLIYTILSIIIFNSCASSTKLIENGQYDRAIEKLVHELAGKKNKKTNSVQDLELAFSKAQNEDLRHEKDLLSEKDESKWEKIYFIHEKIEKRQDLIEPLTPLVSKEGYQASFNFVNTADRKRESKANSIEYYYQSAKSLLEESKNTSNLSQARKAYDFLTNINQLVSNYKDVEQLFKLAKALGTENYLVSIKNNTVKILPIQLEDNLLNISVSELDTKWKRYDMRKDGNVVYNFNIVMNLENLEFSPEREQSRLVEDETEETIKETLKDNKGRVIKDSTGKAITVEKIVKHKSTIEEIIQSKSTILGGRLEWYNVKTKNIEHTEPLNVEINFENKFGRLIKGESDKISKENKNILSGRQINFPTNEEMTLEAGEKLKSIVKNIIYNRESKSN
ncbi:MAG: hypothetical protein ABI851_00965 [Saprospiraceae bacterium]